MKKPSFLILLLSLFAAALHTGCNNANASDRPAPAGEEMEESGDPAGTPPSQEWRDYWYAGKAEMNHYQLQMGRYAEVYPGDAVLIFVAENMHKQKQVKTDNPDDPRVPILKVNFNRKFWTGVYPYSMLSSICTPADGSPTLKVSSSCEEWCGHTYMQLNRRGGSYMGDLHSYFPDEADRKLNPGNVKLEDEVWTMIRINQANLPVGEVNMLPGTHYLRLMHQPAEAVQATATLRDSNDPAWSDKPAKVWSVRYPSIDRSMDIYFEAAFPYAILGWSETYPSFGGVKLTSTAKRTESMMLDYWAHHSLADSTLRHQLGL